MMRRKVIFIALSLTLAAALFMALLMVLAASLGIGIAFADYQSGRLPTGQTLREPLSNPIKGFVLPSGLQEPGPAELVLWGPIAGAVGITALLGLFAWFLISPFFTLGVRYFRFAFPLWLGCIFGWLCHYYTVITTMAIADGMWDASLTRQHLGVHETFWEVAPGWQYIFFVCSRETMKYGTQYLSTILSVSVGVALVASYFLIWFVTSVVERRLSNP